MKEYIVSADSYAYEMRRYDELKELIRCKDCKHMGDVYLVSLPWLEQKEHRCRYWEHPTTPDDYCSWAERKEE